MKNINRYKKIIILLIFVMIIILSTKVFAFGVEQDIGMININTNRAKEMEIPGNKILGVVRVVGTFSAVIALMIIGIKYMLGSVEEKAEYKKTFGIYALGAILIFAVPNLIAILYKVFK